MDYIYTHKLTGIIEVNKGVRINVAGDIGPYYRRLYHSYRYNTVKTNLPLYKNHISIVLPDIHGDFDYHKVRKYHGQSAAAWYNVEDIVISKTNVWLNVYCPIGDVIKAELGIKELNFWGYHMVVCNFKGNL
ncbi:MAG: hypothetical protein EKK57_05030 [Proteobacteria bacterium]|nr:MAG: hypothetical protein EKK57_05030 [Pseudomonadota bacterium]